MNFIKLLVFTMTIAILYLLVACSSAAFNTQSPEGIEIVFLTSNVLGAGLSVQLNGANDVAVNADGTFIFPIKLNNGENFELSVANQPTAPDQICDFNIPSGLVASDSELFLVLTCKPAPYTFNLIEFDVSKQDPFTTPTVYDFMAGFEIDGTPSIVAWNTEIVAQYGSVDYNGDGTFTYTPNTNIQSGRDTFSFKVVNSQGVAGTPSITLNIAKGFGPIINFVDPIDSFLSVSESTINDHYIAKYYNRGQILRKLDKTNHQWLQAKIPEPSVIVEDKANGSIRYYATKTIDTTTLFSYQTYNPNTDSLSESIVIESIPMDNFSIRDITTDETGNIFVFFSRSYTDVNNFSITEYYGKYYSAVDQIWHPEQRIFDGSRGILQQNSQYLVSGKPIVIIRFAGVSPELYEYDLVTKSWTFQILSVDPIVSGSWVYSFQSDQNSVGNVLIFWKQRVIDAQTAIDSWFSKASIFSVDFSLVTDVTLDKIPLTQGLEVNMVELNDLDYLLLSRPYIRDSLDPNYPLGEIYAHYYHAETNQFTVSTTPIVTGHQGSYLNVRPTVILGSNGNAVFTWWTRDTTGNYLHYFKVLPFRENWSEQQYINTVPTNSAAIATLFDANNNYYTLFEHVNSRDGSYALRKYDNASKTNSSIVPADNNNALKGSANIYSTISGRIFIHWSKINDAANGYNICMREVSINVGLSESNLSSEDCSRLSVPDIGPYSLQLIDTITQDLHLFVDKNGSIQYVHKTGNTWDNSNVLFLPTPIGTNNYYFNNILIHPYSNSDNSGDFMSVLVQHTHQYNIGGNFLSNQSIFSLLYN